MPPAAILISPWMDNGKLLSYLKTRHDVVYEDFVNLRIRLVRIVFSPLVSIFVSELRSS